MKKIVIAIIGLGLALNAEEIVSLDGYMLGATGKNINIRHYTESVDGLYFKYAIGQESLDVLYGNVEYDYNMIGLGYSMFELYYKLPMNESLSEQYISNSVDGYMGLDFNMEFRSADFTFGLNFGIFNPPKLKYKEYSWVEETDITGFKMGLNIGYTFGDVNEEQLAKRNILMGQVLQGVAQASNSYSSSTQSYRSSYVAPQIDTSTSIQGFSTVPLSNKQKVYFNHQENSYKYQSTGGTQYKYDLRNVSDRMEYGADLDAQFKDSMNPSVTVDRLLGQYGGGSE